MRTWNTISTVTNAGKAGQGISKYISGSPSGNITRYVVILAVCVIIFYAITYIKQAIKWDYFEIESIRMLRWMITGFVIFMAFVIFLCSQGSEAIMLCLVTSSILYALGIAVALIM